jgi:hypoxanthine-DNA glycosylase
MTDLVKHPFEPIWDKSCRILILGSMPSVQSRARGFYYANPQNRFWPVMAALFQADIPKDDPARARLLLDHQIALWDVLASCEIHGSADSSIRNPVVHDLRPLLAGSPIQRIYANGQMAAMLYNRYDEPVTGQPCVILPSTSPANGRLRLTDLIDAWHKIRFDLV